MSSKAGCSAPRRRRWSDEPPPAVAGDLYAAEIPLSQAHLGESGAFH
jgi:hypothetical protein